MAENTVKSMEVDETLIQNPNTNSDISSDSGSDSDSEAANETQIQALESQLKENPWNYDAHVQCIQGWRKLGNIEKLRESREYMSGCFPLSAKMWQEWAKDEATLNASSEAFADIEKLYERGVHEYLSVPLWCDYLNFAQERDQLVSQCEAAGIKKMRDLFERALTAAGLHVTDGGKIWEAFREYEQAILLTIGDDNQEEKSKQVNRIRALFHRQMSVPLADLKATLEDYRLWEVDQGKTCDLNSEFDGVPANVVSAYQKSMEMYNARKIYEDQLSNNDTSDADRLQCFMSYIKFEESSGDPARVQILYERAVSTLPLVSELWLAYTNYLDNTLKVPNIIKNVYSRAVRSCSWVGKLWVQYMLSLERLGASEKDLSSVFESSIQCVFGSFEEYLDVFLTRVDGLRRGISIDGDELRYDLITKTFQRAADYFSPEMIRTEDLLRLYAYWARLEFTQRKDIDAARGVWESLIKKSGSILEVWHGFIGMEIAFGHINEARSIYKRCYMKRLSGAGSEEICRSWLQFEREYGTLSDFDLAVKKVTPRLQELEKFKIQEEPKSVPSFSAKESNTITANTPRKRKMMKASNDKQPPSKRRKDAAPKLEEAAAADTIKKPMMHDDTEMVDKVENAPLPSDVETNINAEQSVGDNIPKEFKPVLYRDQCTAYISNINLQANEKHLREFFGDSGGVTAIRLLKDKFTSKSRGLAYVDFSDEEHLAAAITKNKQKLLGQKLSIARSDPMQSRKRASSSGNSSRGRGRGVPNRNDRATSKPFIAEGDVKLVGKNTFAAPRNVVRPLGWKDDKVPKAVESSEEPKSNDEFRAMLLKK